MAKHSSKSSSKTSKGSSKNTKTSKKSKPVVETPPSPVPVETVTETETETVEVLSADARFEMVVTQLTTMRNDVATLLRTVKEARKQAARELKQAEKRKKRKNSSANPSGFTKPTLISNQLADFLGVDHGSEVARTVVTKRISAYVKEHGLVNPDNKREMFVYQDKELAELIGVEYGVKPDAPEDCVTYFNLQSYMKRHFSTKDNPLDE